MMKTIGKPRYTYSPEEVIELRDDQHTPYTKRSGYADSTLVVQVRRSTHPAANWVNFNVEETCTTEKRTQSRTVSFSVSREQFAQIVAHVMATESAPEAPAQAKPRVFKVCPDCGDDDIVRNAWAVWDATAEGGEGAWVLDELHDEFWCKDCEEFIQPIDSDKPGTFADDSDA